MAGLPLPLIIAIWLVGAMWIVGLAGYYLGYSSDFVWFVLFLGTGTGLVEWRASQNGTFRTSAGITLLGNFYSSVLAKLIAYGAASLGSQTHGSHHSAR